MEAFILLLVVFGFWPLALALDVCLQKSKTKGLRPLFHKINTRIKLLLSISRPITTLIEILIKLRRSVAWNAQRLPLSRSKMLRQKNNLADVIGVVHKLPVDRLNN